METLVYIASGIGCGVTQKFEQFGKYLLLEKLATGGMAEVFLARAQAAGGITKFVAIKRILPQYAESPEFIDMFKDEAKIAVNLNHSNIVSIYDFGVQHNQFYLVMDYVEGRNLRQILNKLKKSSGRLSIDQVIYIIREVAAGLEHAHRCLDGSTGKPLNITHRDMSPQNVMVSFEGEIKIVDFGIAKAETQLETTRAGTLKGKFGYMSPEQAEGHPVDLRTDIFSLGIVLWELLANDRLFVASNELNTLRKIRDCQVPSLRKINPNIPAELERITMKALARDRNLRYQTAAAIHRDLNRFLNRQYPEFSAQDFASFIKNQFAEDIFSTRQRLVEYAKIPATDAANDGLLNKPSSILSTPRLIKPTKLMNDPHTNSFVSGGTGDEAATGSLPRPGGTRPDTFTGKKDITFNTTPDQAEAATRVSGTEPRSSGASDPDSESESEFNMLDEKALRRELSRAKVESSAYGAETEDVSSPSISAHSRSVSRTGIYARRRRKNNQTQAAFGLAIALFVLSCYSYLAKYHFSSLSGVVIALDPYVRPFHLLIGVNLDMDLGSKSPGDAPVENPSPADPPPDMPPLEDPGLPPIVEIPPAVDPGPVVKPIIKPDPTPVDQYVQEPEPLRPDEPRASVLITSSPSGAEIFVNGRTSGYFTPSRVDVPASREFTITLRRNGFLDYRRGGLKRASVGSKLSATLQSALVGYLDIDVVPPQNARIYINGTRLKGEHLPIQGYAVPAETPIVIKAEDPVSQSSVTRTIKVPKDRRVPILLDLRKSKNDRLPTGKR